MSDTLALLLICCLVIFHLRGKREKNCMSIGGNEIEKLFFFSRQWMKAMQNIIEVRDLSMMRKLQADCTVLLTFLRMMNSEKDFLFV